MTGRVGVTRGTARGLERMTYRFTGFFVQPAIPLSDDIPAGAIWRDSNSPFIGSPNERDLTACRTISGRTSVIQGASLAISDDGSSSVSLSIGRIVRGSSFTIFSFS